MTIGNNIKKLRTAQGLTQDQLAERLFVTRQTVSSWGACCLPPQSGAVGGHRRCPGGGRDHAALRPEAQVSAGQETGHRSGGAARAGGDGAGFGGGAPAAADGLGHAAQAGLVFVHGRVPTAGGPAAGPGTRWSGLSALAAGLKGKGKAAVFDRGAGVSAGQSGPFCLDSSGALPLPHLCVLDVQL